MTEKGKASEKRSPHDVVMKGRSALQITGVEDVLSFDDVSIVMLTAMGTLSVDGENLRIVSFNSPQNAAAKSSVAGESSDRHMSLYYDDAEKSDDRSLRAGCIAIEGTVNGLVYTDDTEPQERGGLFGLFRRH